MSLEPGRVIGPYRIESAAGAGGMGEVYRAKDTRLDRTVAIKVLPQGTSQNDQLRARFEREAKAISSLSHPNICTLYDIGNENGIDYLVMEYLEGDTLSEIIRRGPVPEKEFYDYAIQISDALDKAHRQGLVHRDLKPSNVVITKGGAKLLDFGLAKLRVHDGVVEGVSGVTQTTPLTGSGTIIGTLNYMSPEQLEGNEADPRSDVFAFGALLYEMITGQRAFTGKSQASLIASIMERDPRPLSEIDPVIPPALERLIKKCLLKDPDDRWQSARDMRDELRWIATSGSQAGVPSPVSAKRRVRVRLAWVTSVLATVVAIILGILYFTTPQPELKTRRYALTEFPGANNIRWPRISPDGKLLAFRATDSINGTMIWIRPMNSLDAHPLAGTEGAGRPFWSPDSRYLAYFINDQLKKIPVAGGPAQLICEADGADGCWGPSGIILFDGSQDDSIRYVSASGGVAAAATTINRDRGEVYHMWPWFLPDGDHFVYLAYNGPVSDSNGSMLKVGSLSDDTDRELFPVQSRIEYCSPGYILYCDDDILMARPFDADRLEPTGEPIPVAEDVVALASGERALFSVSDEGSLIYQVGAVADQQRIVWMDREGNVLDSVGKPGQYNRGVLSPDGNMLAVSQFDPKANSYDIWTYEFRRKIISRLTFDEHNDFAPVWSPDGTRILFSSNRNGRSQLLERRADGTDTARVIWTADSGVSSVSPYAWNRSDQPVSANVWRNTRSDIWLIEIGDTISATPYLATDYSELHADISPNGRYIAYQSYESGNPQIYVRELSGQGGKWQISQDWGIYPRWRKDGKELFFATWDILAVEVDTEGPQFKAGIPTKLFNRKVDPSETMIRLYDVTADGQKFIFPVPVGSVKEDKLVVVLNWLTELDRQ